MYLEDEGDGYYTVRTQWLRDRYKNLGNHFMVKYEYIRIPSSYLTKLESYKLNQENGYNKYTIQLDRR